MKKTYKGFDKNLKCRDYQFEIGQEYAHTGVVEVCKSGFHSCENPLHIFSYYPPSDSRFCETEADGTIETHHEDSKIASSKIKIGAEISLQSLIEAGIKFIFECATLAEQKINTKKNEQASNTGDRGAASNTGDRGAASNTGGQGVASNTGGQGEASNTGDQGAASNTGYRGAASNTGYQGAASNTGGQGAASNTGYQGAASNTGDRGAASNTGDRGAAFSNGLFSSAETNAEKSIAIAVGYSNKVRGSIGSWLVLAERDDDNKIIAIESRVVDGKEIKENTWYKLINGKFIES